MRFCENEQAEDDYHESDIQQTLHGNLRLTQYMWLAPADYGQLAAADVICLTYFYWGSEGG